MGLLSAYLASLKPLDVEEPIDAFVQRPLGFLVAKASFPTPITPNQITVVSILLGLVCGFGFVVPFEHHLQVAGLFLFLSAIFDCADGQLARMRKSSSAFGRMLDGAADAVTAVCAFGGAAVHIARMYQGEPRKILYSVIAFAIFTMYTNLFHTVGYDHYKNVYMRMTIAGSREGEDLEDAITRFEDFRSKPQPLAVRAAYRIYLDYLKGQRSFLRWFDPHTTVALEKLPAATPETIAIYKKHCREPMRLWRYFFGLGSLVFGLAAFSVAGRPDLFMLLRGIVYNAIFFLVLFPWQRAASRRAFAEIAALPR